jgi:hypothetical protein
MFRMLATATTERKLRLNRTKVGTKRNNTSRHITCFATGHHAERDAYIVAYFLNASITFLLMSSLIVAYPLPHTHFPSLAMTMLSGPSPLSCQLATS